MPFLCVNAACGEPHSLPACLFGACAHSFWEHIKYLLLGIVLGSANKGRTKDPALLVYLRGVRQQGFRCKMVSAKWNVSHWLKGVLF